MLTVSRRQECSMRTSGHVNRARPMSIGPDSYGVGKPAGCSIRATVHGRLHQSPTVNLRHRGDSDLLSPTDREGCR